MGGFDLTAARLMKRRRGLSKLRNPLCAHMSSAERDKGAVYDRWQLLCPHYNPVWTKGRPRRVGYTRVYRINKGHRLTWNEPEAFLSPVSHQADGNVYSVLHMVISFSPISSARASQITAHFPVDRRTSLTSVSLA